MTTELPQPVAGFRPRGPVIRAGDVLLWFDAQACLDEARRTAKLILGEARDAYEDERRRGFADGRRAGAEEAIHLIARTKAQVDDFTVTLERDVAELVLRIVGEILDAFDPGDIAARAIAKAMKRIRTSTQLTLVAAPEDVDAVCARLVGLLGTSGVDDLPLIVQADSRVPAGNFHLHSEFGQVEVTVETQLRLLAEGLLGLRAGDGATI